MSQEPSQNKKRKATHEGYEYGGPDQEPRPGPTFPYPPPEQDQDRRRHRLPASQNKEGHRRQGSNVEPKGQHTGRSNPWEDNQTSRKKCRLQASPVKGKEIEGKHFMRDEDTTMVDVMVHEQDVQMNDAPNAYYLDDPPVKDSRALPGQTFRLSRSFNDSDSSMTSLGGDSRRPHSEGNDAASKHEQETKP